MIGIRVDSNASIGTGHLMRMLSVAKAINALGEQCVFLSVDSFDTISQFGFFCEQLQGQYDDLALESTQIIPLIKKHNITTLLIDTYFATDEYFLVLNNYTKTAYVFDFGVVPLHANKIINYNITWKNYVYPKTTKCLLGCKNAPLREEFTSFNLNRDYSCAHTVILSTGGSDPYNITGTLLKHIAADSFFDNIKFNVIVGRLNVFASEIAAFEKTNIKCIQNASNMGELMSQSHVCVCAGGSTLYELCLMALPTVVFSFAKNQEEAVETFVENNIMLKGGNYSTEDIYPIIINNLKKLLKDETLRKTLGKKASALVGNQGTKNIAQFLIS